MDTRKLRQKILDLAIRGKLVPQDPNDEPASVLLERIKAEKEQLIKEGKIKRPKKTSSSDKSHYENIPFEIPEGWVWTTVRDISKSILYGVSESAKSYGEYKLLRITDIQNNLVEWNSVPYTDFDTKKANAYLLKDGDILFARTGATVGKSYIVQGLKEKSIYASYLIRVQTFDVILPQYVKFFFESGYYWEQIEQESVGVGQPNVNGTVLGNLQIPIPPIYEQIRIAKELKNWLNIIDSIEKEKTDLNLYISQIKSKILDLAISGKLVPQDPTDEPAVELLKRINPNFTPCDNSHYENLPFEIPQSWCWAKIADVCSFENGYAVNSIDYKNKGIPLIRISNIQDGEICIDDCVFVENMLDDRFVINKGDLLIAMSGATTGKMGVYKKDNIALLNQRVGNIKLKSSSLYHKYRDYFMQSQSNFILQLAYGGAQPNISKEKIINIPIPIPPIEEQHRIVNTIETIFSHLETITAEL